jgi:pimeloyl-ACP methyl ester carboxylesterase
MVINKRHGGSGEPLVLIHGIGHRLQAWEPVFDRLAEHHEVIAIDLPGFGESPVPDGGMPRDMAATVASIAAAFAEWGLDRPHVAGNSLGGAISLELAAVGAVRSATAFSPAGFFTPAERRRALRILNTLRANTFAPVPVIRMTLRSPSLRAASFGPLVARPAQLDIERALGDALALRRGRGFRSVARSSRDYRFDGSRLDAAVPVTVGWGERDKILGSHQAERVKTVIPSARVVTMPQCGHVPMSDDPDLVISLILQTTRSQAVPDRRTVPHRDRQPQCDSE